MDVGLVTRFLFPVPRSSYSEDDFPGELIWLPLALADAAGAAPGDALQACTSSAVEKGADDAGYVFPCLLLPCGTARFLVLYFHRNAEDLGSCRPFCENLRDELYAHVLAVEYPGYGPSPSGEPNAEQAVRHSAAAFAFVRHVLRWPMDSILLFGCSVGTGMAMALASQYEVGGLILVAPFLSVKEAAKDLFGPLAASFVTEQLPSDVLARKVRSPTLIVHGQQDAVIPCRHGEELFELILSRKALVLPADLDHNTSLLKDEWYLFRPLLKFFCLPDYCFEYMAVPSRIFSRPDRGEPPRQRLELLLVEAPGPLRNAGAPAPGIVVLGADDPGPIELDQRAHEQPAVAAGVLSVPGDCAELFLDDSGNTIKVSKKESGKLEAPKFSPRHSSKAGRSIGVFTNADKFGSTHLI